MDERQFDELARRCAAGVNRRRLLRGLAAGTVAAVVDNIRAGRGITPEALAANDDWADSTAGRPRAQG